MTASILAQQKLLAFWSPGPAEMMVLAVVALLLYGGRLPEMARTWGKTIAEFRRSLSGIQSEINDAMYAPDRLDYSPEKNSYSADSVNETSEYDEPYPEEASEDESPDGDSPEDTTEVGSPAEGTPADSDSAEELSSEKRAATESD